MRRNVSMFLLGVHQLTVLHSQRVVFLVSIFSRSLNKNFFNHFFHIVKGPLAPVKTKSAIQKIRPVQKYEYPLIFDEDR